MLRISGLQVRYDDVILALNGISLEVPEGGIVALLGANGAGKSTTLKAVSGLLAPERGVITKGTIELDGERIDRLSPSAIVRRGVSQVMEGRRVFEHLTVEENLVAGAHTRRRTDVRADLDGIYGRFPDLVPHRRATAGYLSGGQQQMLAIGRALMARPRVLLLDEPSLGLAPALVAQLFDLIVELNREQGMTILLVEQNAASALEIVQHAYVMETGRIVLDDTAARVRANEDVKEFYLGLTEVGRKSYRDLKHYKRRKRWLS
ncbi:MAG TPA: ABC transporter ATP-binding protein [Acidimicrobiales bacterium]|nr:ABC transporter ATP-binding protein [Acidimicrobiales bacterium]